MGKRKFRKRTDKEYQVYLDYLASKIIKEDRFTGGIGRVGLNVLVNHPSEIDGYRISLSGAGNK